MRSVWRGVTRQFDGTEGEVVLAQRVCVYGVGDNGSRESVVRRQCRDWDIS